MLADYVYDYFMNMYVYEKTKGKVKKYYTFYNSRISPAGGNRFVFMGE